MLFSATPCRSPTLPGVADLLLDRLQEAAFGRPPVADGRVDVVPAPRGLAAAVVAFTAHAVVAADVDPDEVRRRLSSDDLAAPMSPGFLLWLAGWVGAEPGVLDAVFASHGAPSETELVVRSDLDDHPRVRRATRHRTDVTVWSDRAGRGVVVTGRGLGGRWEMAYEVDPDARGRGLGRTLAAAARGLVPEGEPLFAQVSPGNVASMRSILAAGYRPVASEVLFSQIQLRP
jgi:hypothetical protein